jgi:hypothetical protein
VGDTDRLGHVVHEVDEGHQAGQHHQQRHGDGQRGHEDRADGPHPHLDEHDQRVDEGRREDAERDLAPPIPQERPQHPGGELTAGELEDDDRDGEHQAGEGHHRRGDRGEDLLGAGRTAAEGQPVREGVLPVVDLHRDHGEQRRAHDEETRHEPQTGPQVLQEVGAPGVGTLARTQVRPQARDGTGQPALVSILCVHERVTP